MYECVVTHVRTEHHRHEFSYRMYQWLVDLDAMPDPPWPLRWLAAFTPRDHLGDPSRSIRENLDAFLDSHGIDLRGGKVLMLTHPRVFGYTFNPLTVYWCHQPDGELACVVAEVHNTYGQRHCYFLQLDERGRAVASKQFYVSPFFNVDGEYRMTLPVPRERLAIAIVLSRGGDRVFTAALRGRRLAAGTASLLKAALRHPWVTALVSMRIRAQGIRLFLQGLRVRPRPPHHQEGVQ